MTILRAASAAALLIGASAFGNAAFAGECPAGKIGVNATPPGPSEPKGVTDTVLATTDLSKEMVALSDHQFRLRRLEIQPGGVVPWHSHGDRPAMIYIVSGEVTEYASNCAVPILHKQGEIRAETKGTSHWWENKGSRTVVLYVGDILHDKNDKHM